MNKEQFIAYIKPKLANLGVKFKPLDRKDTEDKEGGYFDESAKELVVAMKNEQAFSLTVHEFSHFEQWVNKPAFWGKLTVGHAKFFNWMDTLNPVTRKVLKWKEEALELEHDCEINALKMIDDLNLEINKKIYAQKANCYLLSYHLMATYHKWPKGEFGDASLQMPTKLMSLSKIKKGDALKGEVLELLTKAFKKV